MFKRIFNRTKVIFNKTRKLNKKYMIIEFAGENFIQNLVSCYCGVNLIIEYIENCKKPLKESRSIFNFYTMYIGGGLIGIIFSPATIVVNVLYYSIKCIN